MMRMRYVLIGCAAVLLAAAVTALADGDREKSKDKGKADKGASGTIQIDLSKLPPDLAKQLKKYLAKSESGKKGKSESKAAAELRLPPGLARKPADHPGRMAWLAAHGGAPAPTKKAPAAQPTEKKKKGDSSSKKGDSTSNLEQRLDRLLAEIEELRREIRKRRD